MRLFKNALAMFCALLLGISVHAQSANQNGQNNSEPSSLAEEGTFQLIRTSKVDEALNSEILSVIESNRKQNEEVIYMLSENLSVRILPYSVINKTDFVPLRELYVEDIKKEGGKNE